MHPQIFMISETRGLEENPLYIQLWSEIVSVDLALEVKGTVSYDFQHLFLSENSTWAL